MCGRSLAGIVLIRSAIFAMLRRATGRSRMSAGVIRSCRFRPIADPYARLTRSRVSWITSVAGATSSGTVLAPHSLARCARGESVYPCLERVDCGLAVEDPDLEVVLA